MAAALDNTVNVQSAGKVTSLTQSMAVASNTLLAINSFNNDARTGMTATFNGNAMALDAQSTGAVPQYIFSIYVSAGVTANIVITVNAAATDVWIRGASWTGVKNQAKEASIASTGTGTSGTATLTTLTTDALFVGSVVNENGNAQSMGADTQDIVAASYVARSPLASGAPGSKTLTVTWTGSSAWASAGAAYELVGDITISVSDAITITESVTMEVNSFIDVSDAITITESVTGPEYVFAIDVFDSVILTESVTVENSQLGDISVNDAITLTESVTVENSQLGDIDVSDTITITDVPTIDFLFLVNVSDDITISESVEIAAGMGDINVSDTITITESVTMFVPDLSSGIAIMRSEQQQYPLGMDDETIL